MQFEEINEETAIQNETALESVEMNEESAQEPEEETTEEETEEAPAEETSDEEES